MKKVILKGALIALILATGGLARVSNAASLFEINKASTVQQHSIPVIREKARLKATENLSEQKQIIPASYASCEANHDECFVEAEGNIGKEGLCESTYQDCRNSVTEALCKDKEERFAECKEEAGDDSQAQEICFTKYLICFR